MSKARLTIDARRRRDAVESLGVKILGWEQGGGAHIKFQVELPNKSVRMLVCPNTGSDHRGLKNMQALVRRWMRESPPQA